MKYDQRIDSALNREYSLSSYNEIVSSTVQEYCSVNGITQSQLAATLGIRQSGVSARLRGATHWSLKDLATLHATYGLEFPLPALAGAK